MKIKKKKVKLYWVDWYRGDWCYRSTSNCRWDDVLECKRRAKQLGERIEYSHYDTIEE